MMRLFLPAEEKEDGVKGWRLGSVSMELVPKESVNSKGWEKLKGTTESSIRLDHPSDPERIDFLLLVGFILKFLLGMV